ncbi:MAG: LpqB family beta-propeller domain-containing protein [Nocardioidaceae bacterium]
MTVGVKSARALAAAVIACASLAACVQLPESSPVQAGRNVGVQNAPAPFTIVPEGPRPGASPREVVSGYFEAMMANPPTATVAREYLTPAGSASWNPEANLVVYEDQTVAGHDPAVAVKLRVLGSLDARGVWKSVNSQSASLNQQLKLRRVAGEWRITNPPQGTFVDTDYFRRNYGNYSLYFFDPAHTVLAPDPVYILKGDATATALVKDLLRGPTQDMTGVVRTAVSSSTTLDVAVTVTGSGVAEVPVSDDVLQLSSADRQLFAAQLAWTLRQLSDIGRIEVTVNGAGLFVPGVGSTFGVDEFSGYDPAGLSSSRQLFAMSNGHLIEVSNRSTTAIAGPIGSTKTTGRSAAVNAAGSSAALVSRSGAQVFVGGVLSGSQEGVATWFTRGHDLLKPSWDSHNVLWLVDRTAHGAVVHAVTKGHDLLVSAPGITGENVTAFAVSHDGVRFAAVTGVGPSSNLVVGVIDRDPAHAGRVSISRVREITNLDYPLNNLVGVTWDSPTSVVVLAQNQGSDLEPYEVMIDGSDVHPPTGFLPVRPTSVAAGPNADVPLVIGASDGSLYVRTPEQQWAPLDAGKLFAPTYPG